MFGHLKSKKKTTKNTKKKNGQKRCITHYNTHFATLFTVAHLFPPPFNSRSEIIGRLNDTNFPLVVWHVQQGMFSWFTS